MSKKESIHDQTVKILDFINTSTACDELRQDESRYSQVTSSLDAVQDTEQAIRAYENKEFGDSKAALYLAVYGLLQAMQVQRDATDHLGEASGTTARTSNYAALNKMREDRHDSFGHPTKRGRRDSGPFSYHQISQVSLSHSGFELFSYYADGRRHERRYINLQKDIKEQRRCVAKILSRTVRELEQMDKEHKKTF